MLPVSNLKDRYLDLVAHTAADEHAVTTEISGLTDQATAAAQAARESMRRQPPPVTGKRPLATSGERAPWAHEAENTAKHFEEFIV